MVEDHRRRVLVLAGRGLRPWPPPARAAGCASPMPERATIDLAQHQAEVANLSSQCVETMLKLNAIYRRAAGETLQ